MMDKRIIHIIVMVFLVTSITCNRDDNLIAQSMTCSYHFTEDAVSSENSSLPLCPTGIPWEEDSPPLDRYNYYAAVFNPNNSNQFAFLRTDSTAQHNRTPPYIGIYTFDMCSGELSLVTEDSIASNDVDWSINDWILYRKWYEDIYVIKSDASYEKKVIDTPVSLGSAPIPIWNGSGNHMAWINKELYYHYPPHTLVCGFVILDEYGVEVDTINQFCRRITPPGPNYQPYQEGNLELFEVDNWSWSPDDKKIACSARSLVDYTYVYGLFYYDFDLDGIVFVDDLLITSWYGPVTSTAWMPDSRKLVWSTERSIVQKDIDTGERKIILTSPRNHWYKNIDISPDGKTIIIERVNRVVVDGCTKTEHALYLVNSDGTDERRIIIPE